MVGKHKDSADCVSAVIAPKMLLHFCLSLQQRQGLITVIDQRFSGTLRSILEAKHPSRGTAHLQAAGCFSCIRTGLLYPTGDQVKGKDLDMICASPGC